MPAARRIPLVQLVRISNPCPLAGRAWGAGEKSWHCPQCDLNVHNFSAMTEAEADAVLAAGRASGRVCASFLADRDGAPITADRPWALRTVLLRNRLARLAAGLGLAALLGSKVAGCSSGGETGGWEGGYVVSPEQAQAWKDEKARDERERSAKPTAPAPTADR